MKTRSVSSPSNQSEFGDAGPWYQTRSTMLPWTNAAPVPAPTAFTLAAVSRQNFPFSALLNSNPFGDFATQSSSSATNNGSEDDASKKDKVQCKRISRNEGRTLSGTERKKGQI